MTAPRFDGGETRVDVLNGLNGEYTDGEAGRGFLCAGRDRDQRILMLVPVVRNLGTRIWRPLAVTSTVHLLGGSRFTQDAGFTSFAS